MTKKNNKNNKNKQIQDEKFRFIKADLISQIAKEGKVTISEVKTFYDIFEKVLTEAITNYSEVMLPGFGKFVLKSCPAQTRPEIFFKLNKKTGRKERIETGKQIHYPAYTAVRFKVTEHLKQAVKDIKLDFK